MTFPLVRTLLQGVPFLLLQVFLFDAIALEGVAHAHLYLAWILFLPLGLGAWGHYTLGAVWALVYGQFHPQERGALLMAITFVLFVRLGWVRLVTPSSAFSDAGDLDFRGQPLRWAFLYLFPLVFVYELVLFPVSNLSLHWQVLLQALGTTVYSGTLLLAVFILVYARRR